MPVKSELKIRLWQNDEVALGPGKAALLEAILQTGSISAAAREMKMSYRRAWLLVDAMNRCFKLPLVASAAGGQKGGGALVTEAGLQVLESYQRLQDKAAAAVAHELDALAALLASDGK